MHCTSLALGMLYRVHCLKQEIKLTKRENWLRAKHVGFENPAK